MNDCWRKQAYLEGARDARANIATASIPGEATQDLLNDEYGFVAFTAQILKSDSDVWYADSGASQHMTGQREVFTNLRPIEEERWPVHGIGANSRPLFTRGIGDIRIETKINGVWHQLSLHSVLFVPHLGLNLLSIPTVTRRGVVATFDSNGVHFTKNGKIVATGTRANKNLYALYIRLCRPPTETSTAMFTENSRTLWHYRLGHLSLSLIAKIGKSAMVHGINISSNDS